MEFVNITGKKKQYTNPVNGSRTVCLSEMRLYVFFHVLPLILPLPPTNHTSLSFLPEGVSSDVDKLDKQGIAPLCRQPLKVSPACSRLEEGRSKGELHSTLLIWTKRALFRGGCVHEEERVPPQIIA